MIKLLLVEDNEMNQDMLSRRLKRKNYEVITADDGVQAIAKAKSELPDLILMDLNIPIIDGWKATSILKTEKTTHHIPVIALTAHAIKGDKERALAAGCDEYETKPVDLKRLLEKITFFTVSG